MSFLQNQYVSMACRILIGLILIYAGWLKLFDMESLAQSIEHFRILPIELINIVAIVLPVLEIIAGACLVMGICLEGALLIATTLFITFFVAVLSAVARGLDIECGCFGTSDAERVGFSVLMRDLILLALTVPIWMAKSQLMQLWPRRSAMQSARLETSNPNV